MSGLLDLQTWSLAAVIGAFAASAGIIAFLGTRLAGVADQLADRGRLGEALMGGLLLGAVTSLSGSVLSITAALNNNPDLALSNAFGGMAAQTLFLAVADIVYRRANLEHAAASVENLMQGALLVVVLAVALMAAFSPPWTLFWIHPGTPVLLLAYGCGMWLVHKGRESPMWRPTQTDETREDVPEKSHEKLSLPKLWGAFALLGGVLAACGWSLQYLATAIVARTGLDSVIMGALFTSVATSLPELVTTIAAVRRGALTLAMSGIIGGNAYDTLFAAFSDVAYLPGSIYHTLDARMLFWIALNILMIGVLLLGMLLRQRRGIGNIGFESFVVIVLYIVGVAVLFAMREPVAEVAAAAG